MTFLKWVGYDQNCLKAAVPIVPTYPPIPPRSGPFFIPDQDGRAELIEERWLFHAGISAKVEA
jgi:hypothetical protein